MFSLLLLLVHWLASECVCDDIITVGTLQSGESIDG